MNYKKFLKRGSLSLLSMAGILLLLGGIVAGSVLLHNGTNLGSFAKNKTSNALTKKTSTPKPKMLHPLSLSFSFKKVGSGNTSAVATWKKIPGAVYTYWLVLGGNGNSKIQGKGQTLNDFRFAKNGEVLIGPVKTRQNELVIENLGLAKGTYLFGLQAKIPAVKPKATKVPTSLKNKSQTLLDYLIVNFVP